MQKIDEDLNHLVAVRRDLRDVGKLPDDLDGVAFVGGGVYSQCIFGEFRRLHVFEDAGRSRIRLLHDDDLFDVFDVPDEALRFFKHCGPFV